jgi:hypothetical protein
MAAVLVATFDCYNGLVIKVYAEETTDANGVSGVSFTIDTTQAVSSMDILGFWIDWGNNGGPLDKLGPGNNMEGSDSCTGESFATGWDFGANLGTPGNDDQAWQDGTVFVAGKTLADVNGAQLGLRIQGPGGVENSLKLSEIAQLPPPEDDHFAARGISHVILLLEDENGANLWIKIDDFGNGQYDLDDCLDKIQDWIAETYDGYSLTGLAVKQGAIASVGSSGTGPYTWYDLDDNNADVDTNAEFTAFWTANKDKQGNIAGKHLQGSIDVVELCPEMAPPPPEDLLIVV